jgi:uncharacterized membrane protein
MWFFILLPYVYLATIWNLLPDQVPTHFNLDGNADSWSGKTSLLLIPGTLGLGIYLLMLIIPVIDPKKKIQQMGEKYFSVRLLMTIFISVLSIYILKMTNVGSLRNPNLLIALIGGFYAILGNYFQTVKPNYFLGIRTPWTLESEQVWKSTHRLAGRLWMIGGLLIVIISFAIQSNYALAFVFLIVTLILAIVPIIYSFSEFKKLKS